MIDVKKNKDISIFDKVGMWLRFLSPEKLHELIAVQIRKAVELGLLEWIPILGRCDEVYWVLL